MAAHRYDLTYKGVIRFGLKWLAQAQAIVHLPNTLVVKDFVRSSKCALNESIRLSIRPSFKDKAEHTQWLKFQKFLTDNDKVACIEVGQSKVYIRRVDSKVVILYEPFFQIARGHLHTVASLHSDRPFGAVAELVDNASDAGATKVYINVEMHYNTRVREKIPVLSIVDNGTGMTHDGLMSMMYLDKKSNAGENQIGRFGVGFQAGVMALGSEVMVFTQTSNSRSIAYVSQSFNEGNCVSFRIPVVSYVKNGDFMEVDKDVQSVEIADRQVEVIKRHSIFNEYSIGRMFSVWRESDTGTLILIWGLKKTGSHFCLEWRGEENNDGSTVKGDILIRSKTSKHRAGPSNPQITIDYSLQSYLEVLFLNPRMRISVQSSEVKCRPLARFVSGIASFSGTILEQPLQLTLGFSKKERKRQNCGIFLYWHNRLIERVGGMILNEGFARCGIIGVIDLSALTINGNNVLISTNKQQFEFNGYEKLVEWLGDTVDEFYDNHCDPLQVETDPKLKPENKWVQCDKCRKWRRLPSDFDKSTLPKRWFCTMPPLHTNCSDPEELVEAGEVTVNVNPAVDGWRCGSHLASLKLPVASNQIKP